MKKLSAAVALIAVALYWLADTLLTLTGWWRLLITILAQPFTGLRGYAFDLWVSSDQYVNTVFRGNPDHTISGRVGYYAQQGREGYQFAEKVIDGLFYLVIRQRNHCAQSIEPGVEGR